MEHDLKSTLDAVALPKPSAKARASIRFESSEHEAFTRWRWGEMNDQEYFATNSMLIAEKRALHYPIPLTQPSQSVRQYVKARLLGTKENDPQVNKTLRKWIAQYVEDLDENRKRMETLVWAKEKLESLNIKNDVEKVQDAILMFGRVKYVESEFWRESLKTLRKDAVG